MRQFMECRECAEKPGSPTLCESCLNNRSAIDERDRIISLYKRALEILDLMKAEIIEIHERRRRSDAIHKPKG